MCIRDSGYEAYNWQNSVGYLQSSKISKLSAGIFDNSQIGKVPTGDVVQKVAAVAWKDNLIAVNGQAYRPGIYVTDSNKVTQTLVVYNPHYDTKEFELTSTVSEKEQVSFKTEALDFTTLAEGSYFFEICTEYLSLIHIAAQRQASARRRFDHAAGPAAHLDRFALASAHEGEEVRLFAAGPFKAFHVFVQ